ncbi:MAG: hypothetical protein KatS3mg008_0138 [Acidimicrobiales bacterium]|nr:MAG: hypothetical protein KatS3mg008_0138 [Acidimicrobiales bacterium]
MNRRTLILGAAVVIGIIAAIALFNYVGGIREDVEKEFALVPVFKADQTIAKGTTGSEAANSGFIVADEIPRKFLPQNRVENLDEIARQQALFDIPAGTPLVKSMFVDPVVQVASFAERITRPDLVAVTIQVDQVRGVAGLLVPGDRVSIFVTTEFKQSEELQDFQAIRGAGYCTQDISPDNSYGCLELKPARSLFQDVKILAVGKQAALQPGEEAPDQAQQVAEGILTLEVPIDAAQWIMSVDSASLYLVLDPEGFEPEALPPLDPFVDRLPGEDSAQVTPYGPNGLEEEG